MIISLTISALLMIAGITLGKRANRKADPESALIAVLVFVSGVLMALIAGGLCLIELLRCRRCTRGKYALTGLPVSALLYVAGGVGARLNFLRCWPATGR